MREVTQYDVAAAVKRLYRLIGKIGSFEIASQIQGDRLGDWCKEYRKDATQQMMIVRAFMMDRYPNAFTEDNERGKGTM